MSNIGRIGPMMLDAGPGDSNRPSFRRFGNRERRYAVCEGFGLNTLRQVARRLLPDRPVVLLEVKKLPSLLLPLHRLILAGVDLIIVDDIATARRLRSAGIPDLRIVLLAFPDDMGLFTQQFRTPADDQVTRLVHVGDLEPEAGTTDLLDGVHRWAALHPDRRVEIAWVGTGCMQGVLEAQLFRDNVSQRFYGNIPRQQLASLFLHSDMLVTPAAPCAWSHVILEAMATGLPVLGSTQSAAVRDLVIEGETGWTFDPLVPMAIADAVKRALATPPLIMEAMGADAAVRARQTAPWTLDGRIQSALRLIERRPDARPRHAIA